jgi:hypothetical protein
MLLAFTLSVVTISRTALCVFFVSVVSAGPSGLYSEGIDGKCEDAPFLKEDHATSSQMCMDACSAIRGCIHAAFSHRAQNCMLFAGQCEKRATSKEYTVFSKRSNEEILNFALAIEDVGVSKTQKLRQKPKPVTALVIKRAALTPLKSVSKSWEITAPAHPPAPVFGQRSNEEILNFALAIEDVGVNKTQKLRQNKRAALTPLKSVSKSWEITAPAHPPVPQAIISNADKADMAITHKQHEEMVELHTVEDEEKLISKFEMQMELDKAKTVRLTESQK